MTRFGIIAAASIIGLSACTTTATTPDGAAPGTITELPEGVQAIVNPAHLVGVYQVSPEDGCYWYQHTGPVETTFLPMRSREGRLICTREQEPTITGTG